MYARSNKKTKTSKKKVTFHHTAFVVLIPTVDEYHNAGLSNLMWWNDCDFHSFKISAADEVKDHMKSLNVNLDAKSALKVYFQQFFDPEDVKNTQHNLQVSYEMLSSQRQQLLESLPVEQQRPQQQQLQQQPQQQPANQSQTTKQASPLMIPMPIAQRHDSITSSKFNNNNQSNKNQGEGKQPLRPPSPPSSTPHEEKGGKVVDLAVLARMVATGFFVLINRS
jgi:hypothetical protein